MLSVVVERHNILRNSYLQLYTLGKRNIVYGMILNNFGKVAEIIWVIALFLAGSIYWMFPCRSTQSSGPTWSRALAQCGPTHLNSGNWS